MTATLTQTTTEASVIANEYTAWCVRYNEAIAKKDAEMALSVAHDGLEIASYGESVAKMTFDLLDRFAGQWSKDDIRTLVAGLGKERAMTDLYVIAAEVVTLPGIVRKSSDSWEDVRSAVSVVHRTTGASVRMIVPRVKARISSKRATNPEATVSYASAAKAIREIAAEAKARPERSDQEKALTSAKVALSNAKLLVEFAPSVTITDEIKALVNETIESLQKLIK